MCRFDDFSARTRALRCWSLLFLLISFVSFHSGVVAAEADGYEAPSAPLQSVRLQLRWMHQFQFAGYYAAVEKGYYREAGLDVRLLEGDTNTEPVDVVLSGAADYGIDDSRTLLARLQGRPVVALAAIFQHSPQVLLVRADSGIRTPHDLAGHKVSITRKRSGAEFPVMFLREGVNLEKILVVSSTTGVEDLAAGRTDAIVGYLSNEVYRLKRMGIDTVAINPVNYGVDYYGDLLFTSEVEVDSHPQRVEAMREATLRGWYYAVDHPEEVIAWLVDKYRVSKSRDQLTFEAQVLRSLILPDLVEIGHMNPGRWTRVAEAMMEAGLVDDDARLTGFVYDPEPHVWRQRLQQAVWSLGGVIAVILLVIVYMFVAQRRLRREVARRRKVEARLVGANELLQRTGRLAKVGGFQRNPINNTIILTGEAARIFGVEADIEISFGEILKCYLPEDLPFRLAEDERALRDGHSWENESLLALPMGRKVWVFCRGEAVFRDGKVVRLVGAIQDTTDRKEAELALVRRTRELEMNNSILRQIYAGLSLADVLASLVSQAEVLQSNALCSVLLVDPASHCLHHVATPSLPHRFSKELDELLARDVRCPCSLAFRTGEPVVMKSLKNSAGCDPEYARLGAEVGIVACWAQPIRGSERRIHGVFIMYLRAPSLPDEDDRRVLENCANLSALVVEHHRAEETIRNLAFFDVLTRLPNRRVLIDRLRQAMANSRRSGNFGALMFLDLDNFKPLNDRFGHHVGDLLLIQVAQRIAGCVRETDTVARFGGDEFVVMLAELDQTKAGSESLARGIAEKVRSALAEPFVLNIAREEGEMVIEHRCTASIGVLLFLDHEFTLDDLIRWSDEAMYQAKEAGRNRVHFRV